MSWTDDRREEQAQLAVLRASEIELLDGPDAALRDLSAPTDPIRMRATIGILLRADRHHDAADL